MKGKLEKRVPYKLKGKERKRKEKEKIEDKTGK
jgi:hypothetical protein